MKKIYKEPNLELIRFSISDDVLYTSPVVESTVPVAPLPGGAPTDPESTKNPNT